MHRLHRNNAPACLRYYRHGQNNWSDVTAEDRQEIWVKLDEMQENRCAYCEDILPANKKHIEHYEQRSRAPHLTFMWSNLFGSCNKKYSCGKYKDKQTYNPQDIIKLDIDDPEDYLHFLSNGRIIPRSNLNNSDKRKAEETLRVFNLSHDRGALREIRELHLKGYKQTAETFAEIALSFDESEWKPLLDEELDKIQTLPFATAIKHVLTEFIYE